MRYAKWLLIVILPIIAGLFYLWRNLEQVSPPTVNDSLSIKYMQAQTYPGSQLKIEQTLPDKPTYQVYIASYLSDGLKIYGLLTMPKGTPPRGGWPAIVFNHGYIDPKVYRTEERYIEYVDSLTQAGYVVFKPDYRGNGRSEGVAGGPYYTPGYVIDDLNALSSLKRYQGVNPDKIGMWGHSMGGNVTLRALVTDPKDIRAAVIWGGVVGAYDEIMNHWQNVVTYKADATDLRLRNINLEKLVSEHGTPSTDPSYWDAIDPVAHLAEIEAPIQLHTGGADPNVPISFSTNLRDKLLAAGKTVEYYNYPGGDHNIDPPQYTLAMARTIAFFDKYLK